MAVGLAAATVAGAVTLSGLSHHPLPAAAGRAAIVGIPIVVGLQAWYLQWGDRFGRLVLLAGCASFLTTLGESHDPTLYAIGRVAGWAVEVLIVYLILSFPSGRLPARADRVLVWTMALTAVTTFVPRVFLATGFEVPSPYTTCVDNCPVNPFIVVDHQPAVVDAVLRPLGVVLVFAVTVATVVRLQRRWAEAPGLTRRMATPVLALGGARAALLGAGIVARYLEPGADALAAVAWALALALPALALIYGTGPLRWRVFAGRALQRIALGIDTRPDRLTLRRSFADAFGDPDLQIAYPGGRAKDSWV